MIAKAVRMSLNRMQEMKGRLEEIAGMLQVILDDEMANFVWPGRLPLSPQIVDTN